VTDVNDVVAALTGTPVLIRDAEPRIPSRPGLYAWWGAPGILPSITGTPHPTFPELDLYYVGIGGDLRGRMVDRHVRGGTGGSTLRRALAGLRQQQEQYRTRWTTTRVVLTSDDERRLTAWIREHLLVTWVEQADPDGIEPVVIYAMRPPLNQDHNQHHPDYLTVKAARAAWRASAGPKP
jgi:hypothetical protein